MTSVAIDRFGVGEGTLVESLGGTVDKWDAIHLGPGAIFCGW